MHPWKVSADWLILSPVGGRDTFHSNIALCQDLVTKLPKMSNLYTELLALWENIPLDRTCNNANHILSRSLWNNKFIRLNRQLVGETGCYETLFLYSSADVRTLQT